MEAYRCTNLETLPRHFGAQSAASYIHKYIFDLTPRPRRIWSSTCLFVSSKSKYYLSGLCSRLRTRKAPVFSSIPTIAHAGRPVDRLKRVRVGVGGGGTYPRLTKLPMVVSILSLYRSGSGLNYLMNAVLVGASLWMATTRFDRLAFQRLINCVCKKAWTARLFFFEQKKLSAISA